MFIGHYAVGFASKRFAPKASLAPLLAAPLLLDILWPVLILTGIEHVRIVPGFTPFNSLDLYDFPWSHSLLMAAIWGAAFGWGYYALTKYRTGAFVIFWGVVSHWVLDGISHTPDMPIIPGASAKVGLGLWNSVAATVTVECALFVIGVWLYTRATRARDRIGVWAWWGLVGVLVWLYAFSVATRKAAPPSIEAIVTSGLILEAVTIGWAWWLDRHRDPVTRAT